MSACVTASPSKPMPSCSVPASAMIGKIDRLARRREQGKNGRRALPDQVEFARRDIAVPRHKGQLRIDLPDEDEIALPPRAAGQKNEREVRGAAETEGRLGAAQPLGDE